MLTQLRRCVFVAVGVLLMAVSLAACDSGTPDASPESMVADEMAKTQADDPTTMDVRDEDAVDVGDVEQAVTVVGRLSGVSRLENIEERLFQDRRKRIRHVTITVDPPNPPSLWLSIQFACLRDFATQPVLLDTKVYVDDELMDTLTVVLGEGAQDNRFQKDLDVLFGRQDIPETMLVTMESEALLLPEGIDLSVTDPYSITEGPRTKAITHTPVRIDFTEPGPKPDAPTPSTEPALTPLVPTAPTPSPDDSQ